MEFKVNSKDLEKLLIRLMPAVSSKKPIEILENFLFEIKDGLLTITGSDLEIALTSKINIVAEENKSFVVPARLLTDVIRSLPDTYINFNLADEGKIKLTTSTGEFILSYQSADEYPELPEYPKDKTQADDMAEFTVNGSELKNLIERAAFAISKEEIRPAMQGLLFNPTPEGLRIVATDGHKLVNVLRKNINCEISRQYIIPEKAVAALIKILDDKDVKINLSPTHISFVLSDIELITRLIGQKYPDYTAVIPLENEFLMKINTKELLKVVKTMIIFATSSTRRCKCAIRENMIELTAEESGTGAFAKEVVPCSYSGEPLEIGFNASYLNDVLTHLYGEDEIIFKLHSPTKAVIIEPSNKKENIDLMMLLMPVRLNS